MRRCKLQTSWLAFFGLLLLSAHVAVADPKDAVCNALQKDQVVILIINGLGNPESDQYDDWAYYLTDFYNSSHLEDYAYFNNSTESLGTIIEESKKFVAPHSMIFMKKGYPSLFHEGPILEPQAYEYVDLFYSQKTIPAHLHQFAPVEADMRLKGCQ